MNRYLLDSHVLLWWSEKPGSLSNKARQTLADGRNLIFVSAITIWELGVKEAKGKLTLPADVRTMIRENRFDELSITAEHAQAAAILPAHHSDPFDRMLIAQANCEGLVLITRDAQLSQYKVATMAA
jgi:PIN domain nuclease of toxin-antitoxin system